MIEAVPKTVNFSVDVRKLCDEKKMDYIDAVLHWCDLNKIDVEFAATLVKKDPMMKSMIEVEAENLNILKKTAKLPL